MPRATCRPNWAILGSDASRGGSPTIMNPAGQSVSPAGLAVWQYTGGFGRGYNHVFTTGQAWDLTGANGGWDAMTIKYTEP